MKVLSAFSVFALLAAAAEVYISELNYDPTGTDTNEFVEVTG